MASMVDAKRAAAGADGSPVAAKRGRLSDRAWADVRRAARLAHEERVTLRVHGIEVTGTLKQRKVKEMKHKDLNVGKQKLAEADRPKQSSTKGGEATPPSLSKRQQRSQQRLQEFQEKKQKALLLKHQCALARRLGGVMWRTNIRSEEVVQRAKLRVKLRSLLWRAWAQYRPIFGGAVLGYTSLREQHVYKRAARLYNAAFQLDPGRSGRRLAAWFHRATPMDVDSAAKRCAPAKGSRKKSRAS